MKWISVLVLLLSPFTIYFLWNEGSASTLRIFAFLWLIGVLIDCLGDLVG